MPCGSNWGHWTQQASILPPDHSAAYNLIKSYSIKWKLEISFYLLNRYKKLIIWRLFFAPGDQSIEPGEMKMANFHDVQEKWSGLICAIIKTQ